VRGRQEKVKLWSLADGAAVEEVPAGDEVPSGPTG
jgi:hypothetical protein